MNKLYALISVLSVAGALSAATSPVEEMHVSSDMVKAWQELKADKFELASKEFDAMADSIEDDDLRDQYEEIAEELEELSKELRGLPIPRGGLMKSMKHYDDWKALQKRMRQLKSQQMADYAQQLEDYIAKKQGSAQRPEGTVWYVRPFVTVNG